MDITPLNIAEVEKFCFEHKRVYFEDLDRDLKDDLEDLIGETITSCMGDSDYAYKRLPKLLDQFSRTTLKKYIRGTFCADARADFRVKSKSSFELDLWVDYYGISQESVDKFPRELKRQLYDKYLTGWRNIVQDPRNNETFAAFMKKALTEEFANTKQCSESEMEYRAMQAILNTGIVEQVECQWSPYMHQMTIKMQLMGQVNAIQFIATIQ